MNVFISYASEQRAAAEEIALALRSEHHEVFFDRSDLPEGDAYNERIREAIRGCDLIVFLVSPEAVSETRYTLTELKFAEERWPSPVGHVLPVMVRPTDKPTIPAYLRAVVLIRPRGNVAAEVVAVVDRLSKPRWMQFLRRYAAAFIGLAVLGGGIGVWRAYEHWRICGDAARFVGEATLQQGAGSYAAAWDRYADALEACPSSDEAIVGREELAMEWLRNIRVDAARETFRDIANKVQPALSRGAVALNDQRAANALAHLGWADFLRTREGASGLDPIRYYEQAVARDPQNPFAHAMWGFQIMWTRGSIEAARAHFDKALVSELARPYVRRMELHAFLSRGNPEGENEVLRVVTEMRLHREALPAGTSNDSLRWDIWNVYFGRLVRGHNRASFLAALSPSEHLATLNWLFPEGILPESKRQPYLFMLAQLQEYGGDHVKAVGTYTTLLDIFAAQGWEDSMGPKARAAIGRLRSK